MIKVFALSFLKGWGGAGPEQSFLGGSRSTYMQPGWKGTNSAGQAGIGGGYGTGASGSAGGTAGFSGGSVGGGRGFTGTAGSGRPSGFSGIGGQGQSATVGGASGRGQGGATGQTGISGFGGTGGPAGGGGQNVGSRGERTGGPSQGRYTGGPSQGRSTGSMEGAGGNARPSRRSTYATGVIAHGIAGSTYVMDNQRVPQTGKGGAQPQATSNQPRGPDKFVQSDYINLEKAIYRLERKNVLKKYEAKTIFADEIKKTLDQLEATFKELKKQTEKEKADVENIEQPSVRSFLKQQVHLHVITQYSAFQGTWDDRFNKEQRDYLDALNKQEVAEKVSYRFSDLHETYKIEEMDGARKQYERAARIAEIYKQQCDNLKELYEKQDEMLSKYKIPFSFHSHRLNSYSVDVKLRVKYDLATIFGSDYASEKENRLEAALDDATDWQQRVSLAKFKWTNGRVLLVHACTQMAFGIARWSELEQMDPSNTRMRYFAAAEARNNFIAAAQNVQSCRVYLGKVQFPYCTEEEMSTMNETLNSAFSDIQSNSTLKKALDVYKNVHKKLASLLQWFDKVINDTILKDLEKADNEIAKKQKQLREERLALMKKKVKSEMSRDLKIVYDEGDSEDDFEAEILALEAEKIDNNEEQPGNDLSEILNLSQPDGRQSSPVPRSKLAPIPDKDALFGDVKQKLDEYDNTRKALEKRNNLQREKHQIELQEKIRIRSQNGRRSRAQRRDSIMPVEDVVPPVDA
ncbi:unnamed protein product [Anisakis simplex]|uniref:Uncharacterized protein n=1 Tax=Anisakis simplex TaxID=6269 RepID=A0A0M3K6A3_ANISI|nr:unnamed protein product [Anisakis simplex]